jgi:type II secretory pathway predicted ATPase ExeA
LNPQWPNLKSQTILEYFGLSREPFNITPDPGYLYLSAGHQQALARLLYGIDARKGFIVLTGEVGTGKTTLIHALLRELEKRNTQSTLIFNTVGHSKDLLRDICEALGFAAFREERQSIHTYLKLVNQLLLESFHKGKNVTLIIDEAQNLSKSVLESIRLMSNFETSEDKLLQIVMAGQPELAVRLNLPSLRQLKQRVVLYHHLKPLNFSECGEYIARRLEVAGGSSSLFTPKALRTIYTSSGGIPRLINILCDNGMLTAYTLGERRVSSDVIRKVAEDRSLASASEEAGRAQGMGTAAEKPVEFESREADRMEELADGIEAERFSSPVEEPAPLPAEGAPDRLTELIERLQRQRDLRDSERVFPGVRTDTLEAEQSLAAESAVESPADLTEAARAASPAAAEAVELEPEEPFEPPVAVEAPPADLIEEIADKVEAEFSVEPPLAAEAAAPPAEEIPVAPPAAKTLQNKLDVLSEHFLNSMIDSLTEAMGPMAPLVLRDQVSTLGEHFDAFPKSRLLDLVELTSREILEEPLRIRFQQTMVQESKR